MGHETAVCTGKDRQMNEAANELAEAKKPGEDHAGLEVYTT
jgi:hypothetical protein